MHPRIAAAVEDVQATFIGHVVTHTQLEDGSVWVTVEGIEFGDGWSPESGELSVKLAPTYPDTGPYPWYLPDGIHRVDGVVAERVSSVNIDGVPRAQLSVNAPWSPGDSLGARAFGVVRWLRAQVESRVS